MKTYRVYRDGDGIVQAIVYEQNGIQADSRDLDPRTDLANHSPTGFEYGYGGSGPAQLALALLVDALGETERALGLYQEFKRLYIATRPSPDAWTMTQEQVLHAVRSIEARVA